MQEQNSNRGYQFPVSPAISGGPRAIWRSLPRVCRVTALAVVGLYVAAMALQRDLAVVAHMGMYTSIIRTTYSWFAVSRTLDPLPSDVLAIRNGHGAQAITDYCPVPVDDYGRCIAVLYSLSWKACYNDTPDDVRSREWPDAKRMALLGGFRAEKPDLRDCASLCAAIPKEVYAGRPLIFWRLELVRDPDTLVRVVQAAPNIYCEAPDAPG